MYLFFPFWEGLFTSAQLIENKRTWFPYFRNGRKNRVTIFLNGQFIIVYTCKPHINHKYSLVQITPRFFISKMLYFG
jgi:hypothetical protein